MRSSIRRPTEKWSRSQGRGTRPLLEPLEDRTLLSFASAATYNSGILTGLRAVAVGDFNRDGHADFAVSASASTLPLPAVVVPWLGNGRGSFSPVNSIPINNNLVNSLKVADFNKDGRLDLLAGAGKDPERDTVKLLLGNGDGSFQAAHSVGGGFNAFDLAVGDFNNDGNADFATFTANPSVSDKMSIVLGKGDGTFRDPLYSTHVGSHTFSGITTIDADNDGKLDLVVTFFESPSQVVVLLGNGDGTFQEGVRFDCGSGVNSVVSGDFDGDGKADLATANSNAETVSVLLGRGNGLFQPAVHFGTRARPVWIATADVNGDHRPDLVTANGGKSEIGYSPTHNTVSVLLGEGGGSFRFDNLYNTGSQSLTGPETVAIADFDSNASPDLVVGHSSANFASILLNQDPAPTTHFVLTAPANVVAGQPFTVTVVARDALNQTVSSFRGTVRSTSSDPAAALPANYAFTAADSGVHVFQVTLHSAGARTLRFTDAEWSFVFGEGVVNVLDGGIKPQPRRLSAQFVHLKRRLYVRVTDLSTGAILRQFRSPFQPSAYRQIHLTPEDADGDGADDVVLVSARKGKKQYRRWYGI